MRERRKLAARLQLRVESGRRDHALPIGQLRENSAPVVDDQTMLGLPAIRIGADWALAT
jgi:hypothetical protein